MAGPASYSTDLLVRYADAGVHHVTLTFGGSPGHRLDIVDQLLSHAS